MGTRLRLLAGIVIWTAAIWAALKIAMVQTPWDHALCGVWGCGPTLPAVLSCHLAWLIAIVPLAMMGRSILPSHWCWRLGVATSVLVVAVVLGVVAREAATWLPEVTEWHRRYFAQRCLFVIATWVDVPVIQLGLVGLFWWTARSESRREIANRKATDQPDFLPQFEMVNSHDYDRR
jgi:hypothetical protein